MINIVRPVRSGQIPSQFVGPKFEGVRNLSHRNDVAMNWVSTKVSHIHRRSDSDLPHIAGAFGQLGEHLGPGQCRQEQRRQNRDDRDNHQQLDKREGVLVSTISAFDSWTRHARVLNAIASFVLRRRFGNVGIRIHAAEFRGFRTWRSMPHFLS